MQINNVTKQAAYLRNTLRRIRKDKDLIIEYNNKTLLPVYGVITGMIEKKVKNNDYSGFELLDVYFDDFNVLHDIQDFLVYLHKEAQSHLYEIYYEKNGFAAFL